jgi:SAM-dependent methyltransferase
MRSMTTHVDAGGFARAAGEYERGRPGYPVEVVEWVAKVTGIGPFSIVVDIGAGTGKLSRELVTTGARVIAVEPVPEMRAHLRRMCPGVEVVDGTAQHTGLGDGLADCVTVAQALHWFAGDDVLRSFAALLRPRGHLAVLWNRRLADQPVQARLRRLLGPHQGPALGNGVGWRSLLARSEHFEAVDELHVYHSLWVDRPGVVDHVASAACVSHLAGQERDGLLVAAASLVPEGGAVELDFMTDAYVYRRTEATRR